MFDVFQTIGGFFAKGGIFMWPLLACSIVSLTVIILRTLALRERNVLPLTIESEMERLAPGANPERLLRIVQHDASSLGNRAGSAGAFTLAALGKRGGGANTGASRDGAPRKRPGRAGSDHRHCAVDRADRNRLGFGARVRQSWRQRQLGRSKTNCPGNFRSAQLYRVRVGDCRPEFDRVRLFFEKSGSPLRGNGIAGDGSAVEVLLRQDRWCARQGARAGADGHACPARNAGNRADGVTQDRRL